MKYYRIKKSIYRSENLREYMDIFDRNHLLVENKGKNQYYFRRLFFKDIYAGGAGFAFPEGELEEIKYEDLTKEDKKKLFEYYLIAD